MALVQLTASAHLLPFLPAAMAGARAGFAAGLGVVVLMVASTPSALASGTPGSGDANVCTPTVGGEVGNDGRLVAVQENASVDCPLASGLPGTPYGASSPRGGPGSGHPGESCSYEIDRPVKLLIGPNGSVTELDPTADGKGSTSIAYPSELTQVPVTEAEQANIYVPYVFHGKYDKDGLCTVPNPGFELGCPVPVPFTNFVVAGDVCWLTEPNPVRRPNGLPSDRILPYLDQAHLLQLINAGTLSSLPDNPNPGLVAIGTCFFVTGASFQVPGGTWRSIQQPADFEMTIADPVNDGTGRYVFYVFRIGLAFQGATWDFGDGSTQPDPDLPAACIGVPADIAASHTYRTYGSYHVSVVEHYRVTVDEYWSDADGQHHLRLDGLIPPIARAIGPYTKQVIQEEGVPVGSS